MSKQRRLGGSELKVLFMDELDGWPEVYEDDFRQAMKESDRFFEVVNRSIAATLAKGEAIFAGEAAEHDDDCASAPAAPGPDGPSPGAPPLQVNTIVRGETG